MEHDEIVSQLRDLNIAVAALHACLSATLSAVVADLPDQAARKERLDLLERDLVMRSIPVPSRGNLDPEYGTMLRDNITRVFRRARKGVGLPD
ncbi:hypothetical protein [Paraburkholderia tropica]|uniref:hypothetical protein n=1 Tax=Paraburkholderia tropica TaxID=92647 RepID=UPI002AB6989E|nr:hypothetical protein [Paraburkholderia tropica]